MDYPALALLEFTSIAIGIMAGDAMVKRSPVAYIQTGTVQPGHYLVLVAGDVASVDEALKAGLDVGRIALRDQLFLPDIHPWVVTALAGGRRPSAGEALGIIETHTVAAAILAADAGVKGAEVALVQLRLGDGLGGQGLVLFNGLVADVTAAVDLGVSAASAYSHQTDCVRHQAIIPQLQAEMRDNIEASGRFGDHFKWGAY